MTNKPGNSRPKDPLSEDWQQTEIKNTNLPVLDKSSSGGKADTASRMMGSSFGRATFTKAAFSLAQNLKVTILA